jgi:hypothetical protein
LAGKSPLNRRELRLPQATPKATRDKKRLIDPAAVDRGLTELFLEAHTVPPSAIVLDLEAPADPVHGHQEDRGFHGASGHYCYVPLYMVAGAFLLCARLRSATRDASPGARAEIERLVDAIQQRGPAVRSTLRADAGCCRASRMAWCAAHAIASRFGLAKNRRRLAEGHSARAEAPGPCAQTGPPARVCTEFPSRPRESWPRARRGVAKAEYLEQGAPPRFVVTSLPPTAWAAHAVYAELYGAQGDMENRIKAQQLALFAARPSTAKLWSNPIRLSFSAFASLLLQALRRLGRCGTEMAPAQGGTIRLPRLKIGALLTVSVRRMRVALASGYPEATLLQQLYAQLRC